MVLILVAAGGIGCGSVGQGKTVRARPTVRASDPLKTTKLVNGSAAKAKGIQKIARKNLRRYQRAR